MQLRYEKRIVEKELKCFHCGETFVENVVHFDDKDFCCEGCKLVYELLNENNLCTYYSLNASPGVHFKKSDQSQKFVYLDKPKQYDYNLSIV